MQVWMQKSVWMQCGHEAEYVAAFLAAPVRGKEARGLHASFSGSAWEGGCNMQYAFPCFFAKLIPWFIRCRDFSSVVLV